MVLEIVVQMGHFTQFFVNTSIYLIDCFIKIYGGLHFKEKYTLWSMTGVKDCLSDLLVLYAVSNFIDLRLNVWLFWVVFKSSFVFIF